MPTYFVKPENALKRAEELLSVSKEEDALDTLHDTIKARRHKTWTKTHEAIMLKHLQLCVQLRKPHVAKDALFQYKTLTQQVAVKSLETVITHFLSLAEQKTDEAQKSSIEKVEEIDDLDQADAPENLLLSAVSGAAAQDRMDRTVLSPWLRFLWDSYRNCLELLRNNAQVETLYHKIARQSFSFCAKYQRRTEFRKLCEQLRMHLNQIQKHQHLTHGVKLTSAESLTLMQDTRLIQLDTAIQMELWQEAYRSAEDVHGMMTLSKEKDKRMVKPATYVNYYDKLALVFFKAGNRLFHAAALLQKYIIFKDMRRSFSAEEAQDQATRVLLATLSIADGAELASDMSRHLDLEDMHTANIRLLSNLLRLPIAPTRQGILKEIGRLNLPEIAHQAARNLYNLLESKQTVSPLRLTADVEKELTSVQEMEKPEYAQYAESLRSVVATKIIKQLSLIYETLSLERVRKIVPFYEPIELERFLVDVSKKRLVQATIDHREKCVRFGSATATLAGGIEQDATMDIAADDIQMGSDGIRGHLEALFVQLRDAVDVLDGPKRRAQIQEKLKHFSTIYKYHKRDDYERILTRRKRIEQYKEASERVRAEKTLQAEQEQSKKEELRRQEELTKLDKERKEFDKRKKIEEQEELKRRLNKERLKSLKHSVIYKKIVEEHGEEYLESMDADTIFQEQVRKMNSDMKEQAAKLKMQEKKWDHMVRAMHLEEKKERKIVSEQWAQNTAKDWQEFEQLRVRKAKDDHDLAVETYERMERVRADAVAFLKQVKQTRKTEFDRKVAEWQKKLDDERRKRLDDRHTNRKKQRREQWLRDMEEEAQRQKQDEEQQQREQDEAKRRALRPQREERTPREDVDSKADADSNWRSGRVQQVPIRREGPGGGPGGGPPGPGGGPPLSGPSPADENQWRRTGPVRGASGMPQDPRMNQQQEPAASDSGPWRRTPAQPRGPGGAPMVEPRGGGPEEERWSRAGPGVQPPPARRPYGAEYNAPAEGQPWRGAPRDMDRDREYQRPPDRDYERGPPPASDEGPWRRAGPTGPPMRDERGPPAENRPWRPSRAMGTDRGPPERGMDRGFPERGMDRGPPERGMDRGPPERRIERGPPERGMDRGYPERGMDRGYPERGMDRGYPERGMDRGPGPEDDGGGQWNRAGPGGRRPPPPQQQTYPEDDSKWTRARAPQQPQQNRYQQE